MKLGASEASAKPTKTRHKKYAYFQHFSENTGKYRNEKKYRKIQEGLKNTGIYRKYRNAGCTEMMKKQRRSKKKKMK